MKTQLQAAWVLLVRWLAREALAAEYQRGVEAGADAAARALSAQRAVDWARGWVRGAAAGDNGVAQ